jgi:N-acetyl-alpha-D-glucosaminyl L-malate synthase BshA
MVCYPSAGGSGIVATELGKHLAERGHAVHFLSSSAPFRLGPPQAGIFVHRVITPTYPLFQEPQYLLALTNRIVQVSRQFGLDIIHAHYAIPHATAAFLATRILLDSDAPVPRVVTTLHGTDITLIGSDPSYSETVAFCIEQSNGVTAVSESLKRDTYRELKVRGDIRVIPNFLDCETHCRIPVPDLRERLTEQGRFSKIVAHVSNFRVVKRVDRLIEVFARISKSVSAKLVLVGDGPELGMALRRAVELGIEDRVESLGEQDHIQPLLSAADLFILPSDQESFGLAALEAMACEVPVVASRVGGLPEVIVDGVTGFLHDPDDVEGMAASSIAVLNEEALHDRVTAAARRSVEERFCADLIVPQYEQYYEEILRR